MCECFHFFKTSKAHTKWIKHVRRNNKRFFLLYFISFLRFSLLPLLLFLLRFVLYAEVRDSISFMSSFFFCQKRDANAIRNVGHFLCGWDYRYSFCFFLPFIYFDFRQCECEFRICSMCICWYMRRDFNQFRITINRTLFYLRIFFVRILVVWVVQTEKK